MTLYEIAAAKGYLRSGATYYDIANIMNIDILLLTHIMNQI
jgi:hypothetical protein